MLLLVRPGQHSHRAHDALLLRTLSRHTPDQFAHSLVGVADLDGCGCCACLRVFDCSFCVLLRAARREAKDAHAGETRQQAKILEATRMAHEQEMVEREMIPRV